MTRYQVDEDGFLTVRGERVVLVDLDVPAILGQQGDSFHYTIAGQAMPITQPSGRRMRSMTILGLVAKVEWE